MNPCISSGPKSTEHAGVTWTIERQTDRQIEGRDGGKKEGEEESKGGRERGRKDRTDE